MGLELSSCEVPKFHDFLGGRRRNVAAAAAAAAATTSSSSSKQQHQTQHNIKRKCV
jgi:hypothetical protein